MRWPFPRHIYEAESFILKSVSFQPQAFLKPEMIKIQTESKFKLNQNSNWIKIQTESKFKLNQNSNWIKIQNEFKFKLSLNFD